MVNKDTVHVSKPTNRTQNPPINQSYTSFKVYSKNEQHVKIENLCNKKICMLTDYPHLSTCPLTFLHTQLWSSLSESSVSHQTAAVSGCEWVPELQRYGTAQ